MKGHWAEAALKKGITLGLLKGSNGKMLPNDPVRGSEALTILNRALGANEQDSTASLAASQQNQWYISELGKAIHLNLIDAADSRNFANAATRAEAFVYIVRAFVYDRAESGTDELSVFTDTGSMTTAQKQAAAALVASGVIKGDTATTLAPDKKLTRAEFVTMITRITGNISAEYTGAAGGSIVSGDTTLTASNLTGDLIFSAPVHTVNLSDVSTPNRVVLKGCDNVTLTADGWALMPYIQEICRQQRSIEERAKDLRGLETGVVRVAVFTSVSVQWMPYILKSFREQYPNIEFELLPSNYNTEIARWIQDGTADCGFLVLPTEPNLDCWLLQRDQWKAIVPWDHPLAGREPFPPEALAQYPFILLEEGDDYEIQEVLDTLGVQPNVQYRVQQDQVILAMVSCGLGISIMEELMLDRNEYPVVACSFAKPFYRNIGICVKDKRAISRSTYRFVEHVRRWVLEKYSG